MTAGATGSRRNAGLAAFIARIGNIKLVCLRNARIPRLPSPHGAASEKTRRRDKSWRSIASIKHAVIRLWLTSISGTKTYPSKRWGFSQRCCHSMTAGSSPPAVSLPSARRDLTRFSPLFANSKRTAISSVIRNEMQTAEWAV